MATRAELRVNSKNVVWYVGASDAISGGSGGTVLPDGIRLLTMVEW